MIIFVTLNTGTQRSTVKQCQYEQDQGCFHSCNVVILGAGNREYTNGNETYFTSIKFKKMTYLHVKALHIIFVVSWFAGLFYLPRIFVYHTEAQSRPDPDKRILSESYIKSARLLLNAIMVPAMCMTLLSGAVMLYLTPDWLTQGWMQLKLGFVAGLLLYHFYCTKLATELRSGIFRHTSLQLRLWNEVATVFLFSIVFLVVLKNSVDWLWGVAGLLIFSISIMTAVRIVKKIRDRNREKNL